MIRVVSLRPLGDDEPFHDLVVEGFLVRLDPTRPDHIADGKEQQCDCRLLLSVDDMEFDLAAIRTTCETTLPKKWLLLPSRETFFRSSYSWRQFSIFQSYFLIDRNDVTIVCAFHESQ